MKKLFTLMMSAFVILFSAKTNAQCDPPAGLAASYSNNVTTFSWNAVPGAVNYNLQIKYPAYNWNNIEYETTVSTNSLSLTGIIQSATFDWRVNTNCGTSVSIYTESQITIPCPSPTGLTTTNIATTSATLNWIPAPGYNTYLSDFAIAYRLANTNNAWIPLGHTFASSKNINGLTPNTSYEWCVNQTCSYFNSNPVIAQFTTTGPGCNIPTGLIFSNLTSTQATVRWSVVSGALTYNVQYKSANSNTWSAPVNTNATSLLLTGLTPATLYNWRVMTNCSGSSSGYAVAEFTTSSNNYCSSYGSNGAEWIDLFSVGTINRVSGAETGGYINSGLITDLTIGSFTNTGQISAGFASTIRNQNFCIYIDFNRNGNFTDAGEKVVGPVTFGGAGNIIFSFNIPGTATPGLTGMRVIMRRASGSITPCITGFLGETEDYAVNLVVNANRNSGNPVITVSDDKIEKGISVSPNPSGGSFAIVLSKNTNPAFYEVINMNGAVVQKQGLKNTNEFTIDISAMPKGLYLLKITDMSGKQQTQKLLTE